MGSSGEGLCFILDGLDEYTPRSKESTCIFQLIRKKCFSQAITIITSRPIAIAEVKKVVTKRVEVLGFLKPQIFNYVEKYDFFTGNKAHSYFDQHPNVYHMCYLPIHAAMVCYLFDEMSSNLPQTETEIYRAFTNHTLLRTLRRSDSNIQSLKSPESLPDSEKTQICKQLYLLSKS